MKQCSTCQEEFADKFSFCPVDGTPLNGFAAKQAATPSAVPPADSDSDSEETVPSTPAVQEGYRFNASDNEDEVDAEIPESVGASASAAADDGEYHLTIMDDAGLVSRLTQELREVAHESQLTWPEFKRDPLGFTKRSFKAYGKMAGGFFSRPNVAIALMTALVSMIVLAVASRGLRSLSRQAFQNLASASLLRSRSACWSHSLSVGLHVAARRALKGRHLLLASMRARQTCRRS